MDEWLSTEHGAPANPVGPAGVPARPATSAVAAPVVLLDHMPAVPRGRVPVVPRGQVLVVPHGERQAGARMPAPARLGRPVGGPVPVVRRRVAEQPVQVAGRPARRDLPRTPRGGSRLSAAPARRARPGQVEELRRVRPEPTALLRPAGAIAAQATATAAPKRLEVVPLAVGLPGPARQVGPAARIVPDPAAAEATTTGRSGPTGLPVRGPIALAVRRRRAEATRQPIGMVGVVDRLDQAASGAGGTASEAGRAAIGTGPVAVDRPEPRPPATLGRTGTSADLTAGHRRMSWTSRPAVVRGRPGRPARPSRPAPIPSCSTRRSGPSCGR